MRVLMVVLALFIGGSSAGAQFHPNMREAAVHDTLIFSTNVVVGSTMLTAGEYRVECDRNWITFYRLVSAADEPRIALLSPVERSMVIGRGVRVLRMPCRGPMLETPSDVTLAVLGVRWQMTVLDRLYLRGSNVAHAFDP